MMHRKTSIPGPSVKAAGSLQCHPSMKSDRRRQQGVTHKSQMRQKEAFPQQQMPSIPEKMKHLRTFPTNYSGLVKQAPPPIPASLVRGLFERESVTKKKDYPGPGKVKIMLRISGGCSTAKKSNLLRVESNGKHVSVFSPDDASLPVQRDARQAAKVYPFDSVFTEDIGLEEICSTSLVDVLQAVLNGADGTVFCYGQANLGKTFALLGHDGRGRGVGLIPSGISWLYRCIKQLKEVQGRRTSVRVSAIEVHGTGEKLRDLLAGYCEAGSSAALTIAEDPLTGSQLQNQCEIPASTPERAAYLLDAALASRSCAGSRNVPEFRRHSHMIYTLHLYDEKREQLGASKGTEILSRLHFIDLGSCEKNLIKTPNSLALSLSSLGHVLMAIINNSKHVPFRQSKLTCVLRNCLGNYNCRAVMIAHVSNDSQHHADTTATIQLVSRIHRVLRKKNKSSSRRDASTSARYGAGSHIHRSKHLRNASRDEESIGSSSGMEYTSGSELSCDTVVYVNRNGVPMSDRDLTDNEGPPPSVPVIAPTRSPAAFLASSPSGGGMVYNVSEARIENLRSAVRQNGGSPPNSQPASYNRCERKSTRREAHSRLPMQSVSTLSTVTESTSVSVTNRVPSNKQHKPIKPPRSAKGVIQVPEHAKLDHGTKDHTARHDITRQFKMDGALQDIRSNLTSPKAQDLKIECARQCSHLSQVQLTDDCKQVSHHVRATSQLRSNEYDLSCQEPDDTASLLCQKTFNFSNGCHQDVAVSRVQQHFPTTSDVTHAMPEKRHQADYAPHSYPPGSRPEPDGCDHHHFEGKVQSDRQAGAEIKQAIYENVPLVLADERPDSMLVNVDDGDWLSPDDEGQGEDEENDAVDINFYCLTLTSRNPLIPVSRRKFSQEVRRSKRKKNLMNGEMRNERDRVETSATCGEQTRMDEQEATRLALERLLEAEKTLNEAVVDENSSSTDFVRQVDPIPVEQNNNKLWAWKVDHSSNADVGDCTTADGESDRAAEDINSGLGGMPLLTCNYYSSSNQQQVIEETELLLEDADASQAEYGLPQNLLEAAERLNREGGNGPAHRKVCLYDSNSLEINYVSSQARADSSPVRSVSPIPSSPSLGKRDLVKDNDLRRRTSRPVIVTKSTSKEGTHLTLVKKETGRRPTLELKVTRESDEETNNSRRPSKLSAPKSIARNRVNGTSVHPNDGRNEAKISTKASKENSQHCSPNPRRAVWPALMRFGSKRTQSKSPKRTANESPVLGRPSIVSKLLTPKVKRTQSARLPKSKEVICADAGNGRHQPDVILVSKSPHMGAKKQAIRNCEPREQGSESLSSRFDHKATYSKSEVSHRKERSVTAVKTQMKRSNSLATSRFGFYRKSKAK